jgi:transcriptional regulator with XRE-family HTH domain
MTPHPLTLYRHRQDPPISQGALARLLGVTAATVCRWESGTRIIDIGLVAGIADKTGIEVKQLRPDLYKLLKS